MSEAVVGMAAPESVVGLAAPEAGLLLPEPNTEAFATADPNPVKVGDANSSPNQ